MNNKESHPIRNGVIASLISGIALTFWEPFREFLGKAAFWLLGILISAWEWLCSSHEIYGWILILLISLSGATLIKSIFLITRKKEPRIEDIYNSDHLFGAEWHWGYLNGTIKNLWCLCPNCKNELVYSEFMPNRYDFTHDGLEAKTEFICERCNVVMCKLMGNKSYALSTVEREIRRKIRNGEWQSS